MNSLINVLLCALVLASINTCSAQRFMRQGMNQEDFSAELKLDDELSVDMTREMFLMQDLQWQLQPVTDLNCKDSALRKHINKYLSRPVELKLSKKRGKFGLRAVGKMENGKKLRAFWRQTTTDRLKSSDFLHVSYDDAVRSRLFGVEFEVQLPPMRNSKVLPSIVYQVSVEPGSMNAKAMVPRGAGRVSIKENGEKVPVGKANVGVVDMKAGLVDPGWAKGRAVFRMGRKSGLM